MLKFSGKVASQLRIGVDFEVPVIVGELSVLIDEWCVFFGDDASVAVRLALKPEIRQLQVCKPCNFILERPLHFELDFRDVFRVDDVRPFCSLRRTIYRWMHELELHRSAFAGIQCDSRVYGSVALCDCRCVVTGVALGSTGGDVHRKAALPILGEIFNVNRQELSP